MAMPQQRCPAPPPEHQLSLPLTTWPNPQQITPPQVWRSLSHSQQQHLFRQMVRACRDLVAGRSEEVRDEHS